MYSVYGTLSHGACIWRDRWLRVTTTVYSRRSCTDARRLRLLSAVILGQLAYLCISSDNVRVISMERFDRVHYLRESKRFIHTKI